MGFNRRQKIWLTAVLAVNAGLWIVPSDVVEQIARDRQTMLGRYSRQHFTWNLVVALISIISFYIDWSKGETYRRRWFQVMLGVLVFFPALAVMDFFLRPPGHGHYVHETLAYHRPPQGEFAIVFEDRPQAYRTYPDAPPGYGSVPCTLRTDERGYRNAGTRTPVDVLVLGDSFAEGSNVSDEHVWPARLAAETGLSVYNLGMSGYDPIHYLASLNAHGSALRPKIVLCLLYEGNDFRSARSDLKRTRPPLSERIERYVKQSPVINALDGLLIRTFGPIGADGPVRGAELLEWMPVPVPDGPDAKYYAFAPKQLRDLYRSADGFSRDRRWLNTRRVLAEMRSRAETLGARLIVAYAPTKAHVVLPLARTRLEVEKVRAFTAMSYDRPMPDANTFLTQLQARLDGKESVVAAWCEQKSVPFLSLTGPLRKAAAAGTQVYYTYDQHWTPEGHGVVAESVGSFVGAVLSAAHAVTDHE